jgi:hypothetical protein
MGKQAPLCLAMILCDAVQIDQGTNKATILGAFSSVVAGAYPAIHPQLAVFVELTDARGETPLVLKLCRATADDPDGVLITSLQITYNSIDPLSVGRIVVVMGNVPLPEPGEYRVVLTTEAGLAVSERRLMALTASL